MELIIQYRVGGEHTPEDSDKRLEIENLMEEFLDRTGLGHCIGGALGSGTMNIFCSVVDTDVAFEAIVDHLRSNSVLGGAVIAQRIGEEYRVFWPDINTYPNFLSLTSHAMIDNWPLRVSSQTLA